MENQTARFAPVRYYSVTDQVYDVLKERILTRQVGPGQRLNLDELEHQLEVSRTPLKDAINRLAMEGLVKVYPRKGTFVTSLTQETLREVFEVRLALELYAGEQGIGRITPEALRGMQEIVADLEGIIDGDVYSDYGAFIAKDRAFHSLIIDLVENQTLHDIYQSLNVHVQIVRAFYTEVDKRVLRTHDEHKAILRAFETRDQSFLKDALTTHINSVRDFVLGHMGEADSI